MILSAWNFYIGSCKSRAFTGDLQNKVVAFRFMTLDQQNAQIDSLDIYIIYLFN